MNLADAEAAATAYKILSAEMGADAAAVVVALIQAAGAERIEQLRADADVRMAEVDANAATYAAQIAADASVRVAETTMSGAAQMLEASR